MERFVYEYYSQFNFLSDLLDKASTSPQQDELQILIKSIDCLQVGLLVQDLRQINRRFSFETYIDLKGYSFAFENLDFLTSLTLHLNYTYYALYSRKAGRNVKKINLAFSDLSNCEKIVIKDTSEQSFMKYATELTISECPLKALTIPTDMTVKNIEGCPLKFNSMKKNGGFKITKQLSEKKLEEITNDDDINTADLKEVLKYTPSSQNILLVGRHGIGKSEILTDHFKTKE